MKNKIKLIEEAINSRPCMYCGKQHRVKFNVAGTDLRATVSCGFSDDACDEYKNKAVEYITLKLQAENIPVTLL